MNMRPLLIVVPIIAIGCTSADQTATDDSADEVISASSLPVEQTVAKLRWTVERPASERSILGHWRRIGFTADNAYVFTDLESDGKRPYRMRRWSVATGELLAEVDCQCTPAQCPPTDPNRPRTYISPNGDFAALYVGGEPSIWLLDANTGKSLATLRATELRHFCWNACAFSPDSSSFAFCESTPAQHAVCLVKTREPSTRKNFVLGTKFPNGMCFSPDSKTLVVGVLDKRPAFLENEGSRSCILIDIETGKQRLCLEGLAAEPFCLADGRLVAIYEDYSVPVYGCIRDRPLPGSRLQCFDVSGPTPVSVGSAFLLPRMGPGTFHVFVHPTPVGVIFKATGKGLGAEQDYRCHKINLKSGHHTIVSTPGIYFWAISRDGCIGLTIDDDGCLMRLWEWN